MSVESPTPPLKRNPIQRTIAWLRSYALIRPIILLLVFLAITTLTIYFYPITKEGTYAREVVVAAIGSLITIIGAIGVAIVTFPQQIRAQRENRKIQHMDEESWNKRHLTVGGMVIDDIVVVKSGREKTPWTDLAVMEWQPTLPVGKRDNFSSHKLVDTAREQWLGDIERDCKNKGIALSDDACVDMVDITISYVHNKSGRRIPKYTITPAIESYYNFLCSTANLDRKLIVDGQETTLRENVAHPPTDIESVRELPFMTKVGVGTVAITSDGFLVLGVRGRTAIAGQFEYDEIRKAVHIVAEGMIPEDRGVGGTIDPQKTSSRALEEELGISSGKDAIGEVKETAATGFFFDQLRYQPCFAYIAHLDVDRDQLQAGLGSAQDSWEVEKLFFMRFDPNNAEVIALLRHEHPYLKLASNHAHAVLWFACLYQFGYFKMRDCLNTPLGRIDNGQYSL
ncbi:hypothetical protein [Boudabousia marimammalium]|uniref:Nudix hydrolase domain-containing protein n=1 Tax=Boudabousia marimammalium TaxID=156892 RepID=A0A1Q5PL42_9ACTO|nr:hypothetical protein [Boudabousia marimammalium]OKL47359.1 hypothetical protein BM477_06735 [Boudabousia marimammalium]